MIDLFRAIMAPNSIGLLDMIKRIVDENLRLGDIFFFAVFIVTMFEN